MALDAELRIFVIYIIALKALLELVKMTIYLLQID